MRQLMLVFFALCLACRSAERLPDGPAGKLVFEPAPPGEVTAIVREKLAQTGQEKRSLLVYVGAPWCEPCTAFHDAAKRGELDAEFPGLTLLEFDADKDGPRLSEAGYSSELIPLFARPGPDGRASGRMTEGARKGGDWVADITPRLRALLAP